MKSLFDLSTEERVLLAQLLKQEGIDSSGRQSIRRREVKGHAPLSYAQRRLWFLYEFEADKALYNIPTALRLKGHLQVGALAQAISEIVKRHEALRTSVAEVKGNAVQVIHEAGAVELRVVDLRDVAEEKREEELGQRVREEAGGAFDLSRSPLLRAVLMKVGEEEHVLVLTMHHIASDGWSLGVLAWELGVLYEAYSQGEGSPLEELPIQYADYAVWQREWLQGEVEQNQLGYWRKQLAGMAGVLDLPMTRPRPAIPEHRGALHRFQLSKELVQGLREVGRKAGVTQFMTLLAALQVLLGRYSGETDIAVGTPIAGRTRKETEGMIGFFVNTLVMRTELSGNPSFAGLLKRVRETALGAYANQDIPFEKLVQELQPARDLGRSPLFQVMLALQNVPAAELTLPGLQVRQEVLGGGKAKFDITLSLENVGDRLAGQMEYDADLFDGTTIERMARHYQKVLEGMVADVQQRVGELPLLTGPERELVVEGWNRTEVEYDKREGGVAERFEAQVEQTPQAVALVYEGQELSYRELNGRANQLARYLRRQGVGPEVRVGVCVERSPELVVALLAVLKAGGAYVPLDPDYPPQRLSFMVEDAGVRIVLTRENGRSRFAQQVGEVFSLDTDWSRVAGEGSENLIGSADGDHAAYIIYTSGSTGQPKGVVTVYRGVNNQLGWLRSTIPLTGSDRVLQRTSIGVDASIVEILPTLVAGARVVVARQDKAQDMQYLVRLIAEHKITYIDTSPSLLRALLDCPDIQSCHSLRVVVTGGEPLSLELEERFFSALSADLYNMYGPTEATVQSTCWKCLLGTNHRNVPIGRPIANTQIYILDEGFEPMPVGVFGELHIGGVGLARGYMKRAELTAEKFIPHPFARKEGERLYRTGDVARLLGDGNVEFRGRQDEQVKVRGFRIELGEIEAVLEEHPGVRSAVVAVQEKGGEDQRLVAYVVGKEGEALVGSGLRKYLGEKLPSHMVPGVYVMVKELPRLASGKVDRKKLPAAEPGAGERKYVAPRTQTEEMLAGIWSDVLGSAGVGVEENFFELGGHSLLATQVVSRVRSAFGIELPLRTLFETPTVAGLAHAVSSAQVEQRPVNAAPIIRRTTQTREELLVPKIEELSEGEMDLLLESLSSS